MGIVLVESSFKVHRRLINPRRDATPQAGKRRRFASLLLSAPACAIAGFGFRQAHGFEFSIGREGEKLSFNRKERRERREEKAGNSLCSLRLILTPCELADFKLVRAKVDQQTGG
jgi:hypothetical protein